MSYEAYSHLPPLTTARLVHDHFDAEARIAAVRAVLAPLAQRTPGGPVPDDLVEEARQALRPATRVAAALGGPKLLPLHVLPTASGLAARLALAAKVVAQFEHLYYREFPSIDEGCHWAVREWLAEVKLEVDCDAESEAIELAARLSA